MKYSDYMESAEFLRNKLPGFVPKALMILGSGLGFMGDEVQNPVYIDYREIPHFRTSTAPGHKGRFVAGDLCGVPVLIMQGRMHVYEGYTAEEAAYPVRVAHLLGAEYLFVTNAAGAVNEKYSVGDMMLIKDHIKLFPMSPLTGENISELGPRFCDMTYAYDPALQVNAVNHAKSLGITLHEGVYFYFPGPQFETPSEVRAARVLGGDAVGMSTVFEVIAASHCGMRTLGISLITNMGAGILPVRLDEFHVIDAAERARDGFSGLVKNCLSDIKDL